MALASGYPNMVWEDLKFQCLPLYLLAGDNQSLIDMIQRSFYRGEFMGESEIRKLIQEGDKNNALPETCVQNYKLLDPTKRQITSFDLGFEFDVFGVHPSKKNPVEGPRDWTKFAPGEEETKSFVPQPYPQ